MANHLFDGLFQSARPDTLLARLETGKSYTYQDALVISARYANTLIKLGLKPGDRLAVQAPKSIDMMMLYLASLRAGTVFLPLNTAYTANEVNYFLDNAGASLFVCDPDKQEDMEPVAEQNNAMVETLGNMDAEGNNKGSLALLTAEESADFENIERGPNDLAAILYTSGTTGRSKGAMLSHDNMLSNARGLISTWRYSADDSLIHALPIFHTHGLFVAINVTMTSGASMIFLPAFSVNGIIDQLPHATVLMGVPTFYTRLLNDERLNAKLVTHMRVFISGSAPLLAETHEQFEARTGHRILERYGMTETNMNTSNPYEGERRAGTVGFPLPGVELKVCDPESGDEIPRGEIGSIELKGPNVFSGYWEMPEKTAEEFRNDGYFITGDLGKIDEDGYLHIVGRNKDLIISGGYNIYPKEIELILDEDEDVLESAVIGVPHPDFGEAVVGVVVPSAGRQVDTTALAERVNPEIARFKQPKKIYTIDALPRNTMGKVQKNVLRDTYANTFVTLF